MFELSLRKIELERPARWCGGAPVGNPTPIKHIDQQHIFWATTAK